MTEVVELTRDDLEWSFHDEGGVRIRAPRPIPVDSFPAYPHDAELVRGTLESLPTARLAPERCFVLPAETPSRTNGWAEPGYEYDQDSEEWVATPGTVVLPAKRIPPHPAVTRYVVAHEYGHHVRYTMSADRGEDVHAPREESELLLEYARLRELEVPECFEYGGGRWHSNVEELFVNDWRVLVAKIEVEYWPHPGFAHPWDVDAVLSYWEEGP